MSDGTYWVTGKDLAPTHFDATGKEIEAFSTALFQQHANSQEYSHSVQENMLQVLLT